MPRSATAVSERETSLPSSSYIICCGGGGALLVIKSSGCAECEAGIVRFSTRMCNPTADRSTQFLVKRPVQHMRELQGKWPRIC